jgi:hypothetical protein
MLSVTHKPFMPSVVMLNVVMLSVMAPLLKSDLGVQQTPVLIACPQVTPIWPS